jgi:hypothetical protein
MANLPPPALTGPTTNTHTTFAAFYGDETLDPCQGNYQGLMQRFNADENPGLTPQLLFDQATEAGLIPQAYLCCSQLQHQTRIKCIHLPTKFMSSFTGTVTQWDGMGFAYLGEITQMYATTVQFPNTAFRAATNVRAKTADYIVTHLNEIVPQGFPPPADNDADSSLMNTRQFMCLPARYVPLLLDPAGYTLGQTWNIIYQAIVDADDLQTCQALVNWLRVASTSTMTQVPGLPNVVGPSTLNVTLNAPIADGVLINHRLNLLRQVLPALFQPSNPFEAAITQMAVAVTENTNDNRVAREQKAAAATAPKLLSDKFGVTLPMLLEYLNIADEGAGSRHCKF